MLHWTWWLLREFAHCAQTQISYTHLCLSLPAYQLPLAPTLSHLRRLSHMRRPWLASLSARAASCGRAALSRSHPCTSSPPLSRPTHHLSRPTCLRRPTCRPHDARAVPRPCPLCHPSPMPPAPTTQRSRHRYDALAAHTMPAPPSSRRRHDAAPAALVTPPRRTRDAPTPHS
ncbi:hypothetical protein DENSPDRAFT_887386 [Dentipellis sp. KUC8613]|nr:hypothetical protein DENSPDRAFT_887386 [Dentipellis sp. KUC8613]